MLHRCIDGHVHGRLARCPSCFKGKLQLKDEDAGATLICKGYFDEDSNIRIPCGYTIASSKAQRLQPWYSEEPTEEQIEAMKAVTEKHEAIAGGKASGEATPDMIKAAEDIDIDDWEDMNPKEKAQEILVIGQDKITLPQDEKKARQDIGKMILHNMDASPVEVLKLVVAEFGMAEAKQEAKAKQQSAMKNACACPANAGIIAAFQELMEIYFKEGNGNAGASVSLYLQSGFRLSS